VPVCQICQFDSAKQFKLYQHYCIGDMYNAEMIIPQMNTYSVVVAQFPLLSKQIWNFKKDNFDYWIFYCAIII
jgi:hypothetical protein